MSRIACPECGAPMVLRLTTKFRHRDGTARSFYGCSNYPDCSATHGAHPDGTPMGIPGDAATKAARVRAHAAFDLLWQGGGMSRRQAYRVMQGLMRMTEEQAHIGRFTVAQCETLIARLEARVPEVA